MSPEARVASQAHRRATRKKRIELRRRGFPMILWKDGKVCEVPAQFCSRLALSRRLCQAPNRQTGAWHKHLYTTKARYCCLMLVRLTQPFRNAPAAAAL